MELITSVNNQRVKDIANLKLKKYRTESGMFFAEGLRAVREAVTYAEVAELFFSAAQEEKLDDILKTAKEKSIRLYQADDKVMAKLSDTKTPQGVLAVIRIPAHDLQKLRPGTASDNNAPVIILDRIQDPGNLGTIIRIADWFGLEGVFASEDSVDLFNPKVVQSTMGAIFRVRFHYTDLPSLADRIRSRNGKVYGTFLDGNNLYDRDLNVGKDCPCLVVTGNESNGISPALAAKVNDRLYIPPFPPGEPGSESLNAAVATAVVIAEFRRRCQ